MRRFIICLFGFLLPVLAAPAIYDGGVVNGADFTLNFSPGMLISVFGTNLASATKLAPGFPLPTAIDGVSVEVIDGARTLNAPLFFVSAGQINAQLPFDITSASVQVRVKNATGTSAAQTIAIVARCPRLLTKAMNGRGEAILTHADYTVVSTSAPALAGEVVVLYMAGLGAVSPSIAAGQAAGTGTAANPLNVVQDEVVVKVGGVAAKVHYKGLAPYFAGLYQINFQVPDNAQQAISELTVEMGKQVSQGRVRFAVATPLQNLTAGTISSGGGSVAASGFSMTVPAGAVAQPADITLLRATAGLPVDSGRVSDVYAITGLPDKTSAPITLAINYTGPPPDGDKAVIVLQQGGYDSGWVYLPATVQGNLLIAALAANAGTAVGAAAKTGTVRRLADDGTIFLRYGGLIVYAAVMNGLRDTTHFRLRYPKAFNLEADDKTAHPLWASMEDAVQKLSYLGFSWPWIETDAEGKPTPARLEVTIPALTGSERLLCGGDIFYSAADGQVRLRLNANLIANTANGQDTSKLTAKLVHLLFHFLRHPDKPAAASDPWIWMDEAVATWLEQKVAMETNSKYVPLQQEAFWNFAPRGLEASAATTDREELMMHGWGASRFLEALVASKGSDLIKEIYQVHAASLWSAQKPVEVLRSSALPTKRVDISAAWESFVSSKGPDTFLLPDRTNLTDAIGSRNGTLLGKANETVVFNWSAPHLSAQFFQVIMPAQWSSGSELSAAATGDADITLYYYRVPASGSPEVLPEKNAFERKTPGTVFKSGDRLWIVVVNKKAVSPFTSRTPVSITVRVQTPQPSFLTSLRTMTLVTASIDAAPICSIDKDFQFLGLCPRALLVANNRVSVAGLAPFNPVSWDREFTTSDYGTTAFGVYSDYAMSFKLSETGGAMQSAKVESTATWRQAVGTKTYSMERKMSFSVADIPHVYPFSPSNSTLLHSFQVLPLNGAQPKNLLSWSYTITADGILVGSVTGIDWTRSLLADGKAVPRQSGTPGISIRFDK